MIPDELARAWLPDDPGAAVPPGPRTNPWASVGAVPVAAPHRIAALLDGLWHDGGPHLLPNGRRSTIARRPVPSAGGAYPVQTHLVIGDAGFDGLDPGRYVLDRESMTLLCREHTRTGSDRSYLVFTALPGRSYSRYRHRAWPLWIADAAYAVAAAEFLWRADSSRARPPVLLGPDQRIRALLGFAAASDADRWIDSGLVPEIALAAMTVGTATAVSEERRTALRNRRSPAIAEFTARIGLRRRATDAAVIARAAGQGWVLGADRVRFWSVTPTADTARLRQQLWTVHRTAAHQVYRHAVGGECACRPVSGTVLVDGRWPVHAVAALDRPTHRDRP